MICSTIPSRVRCWLTCQRTTVGDPWPECSLCWLVDFVHDLHHGLCTGTEHRRPARFPIPGWHLWMSASHLRRRNYRRSLESARKDHLLPLVRGFVLRRPRAGTRACVLHGSNRRSVVALDQLDHSDCIRCRSRLNHLVPARDILPTVTEVEG